MARTNRCSPPRRDSKTLTFGISRGHFGLDLERFDSDRRSDAVKARVKRDFESGIRAGVVTTPTLIIGERMYTAGEIDQDTLDALSSGG